MDYLLENRLPIQRFVGSTVALKAMVAFPILPPIKFTRLQTPQTGRQNNSSHPHHCTGSTLIQIVCLRTFLDIELHLEQE